LRACGLGYSEAPNRRLPQNLLVITACGAAGVQPRNDNDRETSLKNTLNNLSCFLSAVLTLIFVLSLPMAAHADLITLTLPGITGDVTAKGLEGAIEVLSLTGNVQQTVNSASKGAASRRTALPSFTDLMIQKRLDQSSPALFIFSKEHFFRMR
jgi:hypothetical protein